VYEPDDRYRKVTSRNVVLMNEEDIKMIGLKHGDSVRIKNDTGKTTGQKVQAFPIKTGNIMMYYPESNIPLPRQFDPQSKTFSFKSIEIFMEKQS
jgi:anaerobic selenocysteine-containing dehydrogenase